MGAWGCHLGGAGKRRLLAIANYLNQSLLRPLINCLMPFFLVGSLMYAMTCTRPDIAYAVSVTSTLTSNPGLGHWNAWLRIMFSLAH